MTVQLEVFKNQDSLKEVTPGKNVFERIRKPKVKMRNKACDTWSDGTVNPIRSSTVQTPKSFFQSVKSEQVAVQTEQTAEEGMSDATGPMTASSDSLTEASFIPEKFEVRQHRMISRSQYTELQAKYKKSTFID